jgi:hypothetical protein
MFDMAGMAADIAGNARHGARSRDHIVASTADTAATANNADIANIADTEHPSMDCSRGYRSVRGDRR